MLNYRIFIFRLTVVLLYFSSLHSTVLLLNQGVLFSFFYVVWLPILLLYIFILIIALFTYLRKTLNLSVNKFMNDGISDGKKTQFLYDTYLIILVILAPLLEPIAYLFGDDNPLSISYGKIYDDL